VENHDVTTIPNKLHESLFAPELPKTYTGVLLMTKQASLLPEKNLSKPVRPND
jgi:hypothetical protein